MTAQAQSLPTTLVTNHQPPIIQNPLLLPQNSQSYSFTSITPAPHLVTSIVSNDSVKQAIPSSASITTEAIENSLLSVSPTYTNDMIQASLPSDTSATPQPPVKNYLFNVACIVNSFFLLDIG